MNRFDTVWNVFTKPFHDTKDVLRSVIGKKAIEKIKAGIDDVYPKLQSRNALIFARIVEDMEKQDADKGDEHTGWTEKENIDYDRKMHFGYSRKELYILAAKWFIVLYDVDRYYSERIDFAIAEMFRRKDEFYLDEQAEPKNWFPNRPENSRYMRLRRDDEQAKPL